MGIGDAGVAVPDPRAEGFDRQGEEADPPGGRAARRP